MQPSINLGSGYATNEHQPVVNQRDTTNKPYTSYLVKIMVKVILQTIIKQFKIEIQQICHMFHNQTKIMDQDICLVNINNWKSRDTTNIFIIGGQVTAKSTLRTVKTDGEYTRPFPNKECNKSRPNAGNMLYLIIK